MRISVGGNPVVPAVSWVTESIRQTNAASIASAITAAMITSTGSMRRRAHWSKAPPPRSCSDSHTWHSLAQPARIGMLLRMRIGLISDTHVPEAGNELWPQVYERLAGVDLLLHGGDIHDVRLIDLLEQVAPIYVARGNGDDGSGGRAVQPEDPRLREAWTLELEGFRVGLTHDMALPEWPPYRTVESMMERYFGGPQHVVVHGDTHVASVETIRGVLLINPGSPMYPRNLDTRMGTLGFIDIEDGRLHAWLEQIDEDGTHLIREQPKYSY